MPNVAVYNMQGEQVGEMSLSERVFAAEIKEGAMKSVVQMQLANKRLGTASTKTRGEVRGGGRKPWRQKGTGRARHGSIRSPIWVGGGTVFGPRPRSYRYTVPKKVRRAAIRSALSAKVARDLLLVLDKIELEEPKTKVVANFLQSLNLNKKVLFVTERANEVFYKSARNIPGVRTLVAPQLNVLDILNHDYIVLTRAAVSKVEEVFA
ncbi:MAG: 50S ribosomal protein L4 [Dethiobacteria bacterium]|jgi:large subunit ribosomal protein L4|nr:50S ribosomal protein L4 [Bacillota bacterium]